MICSPRAILMLTAVGALGACSTETLPPTNTAAPTASVVTTQPGTTIPVVPGTVVTAPGTVVTAPGTVAVVPSSGSSTVAVVPAQRLNNFELLALMNGNTASGTATNGQPYYAHFQRSGRVDLHEGSNPVAIGTWRVTDDGQLCSGFSNINAGLQECYTVYRNGASYVYERPDGRPVGSFVVQPGA
jgi:hypothetical protein